MDAKKQYEDLRKMGYTHEEAAEVVLRDHPAPTSSEPAPPAPPETAIHPMAGPIVRRDEPAHTEHHEVERTVTPTGEQVNETHEVHNQAPKPADAPKAPANKPVDPNSPRNKVRKLMGLPPE